MQNIIKAITYNAYQLCLASILLCLVVFMFSQFGFFYLRYDYFFPSIYPEPEDQCSNPTRCFLHLLALAPRSSGSIGDLMIRQSYSEENKTKFFIRYVYDLLIFIIVNVIGMNILFGIILDTFKQLRLDRKSLNEDQRDKCFICGIGRNQFDKQGGGFENHIKFQHNFVNYIRFIYHIFKKDMTEYTGIESWVFDQVQHEKIEWFPSQLALCLGKTKVEDEDSMEFAVTNLSKHVDELKSSLEIGE